MTCCGGTAAVLSVLGFVAVLVGVATPGWFQMSMDLSSMESSDSSFGSNTLMEQMGSVSCMHMHLVLSRFFSSPLEIMGPGPLQLGNKCSFGT